jgi:hypothetical protein
MFSNKKSTFEKSLNSYSELLDYKVSEQREDYNNFMKRYYGLSELNGTVKEKMDYMNDLLVASEKYKTDFVDSKMKDNMFKTYWELQSKFIDLDITER